MKWLHLQLYIVFLETKLRQPEVSVSPHWLKPQPLHVNLTIYTFSKALSRQTFRSSSLTSIWIFGLVIWVTNLEDCAKASRLFLYLMF